MNKEYKHKKNCECVYCKNMKDFEMPKEIIEAVKNENLIIFAGAGVSTESKNVFNFTLYEDILNELNLDWNENLTFSKLMSKYCEKPNGRSNLLKKIKDRFDYVTSFPELYRRASNFHNELSTIPTITEIITTNWDTLFEDECGCTPFVTSEDFVFSNIDGRKVYKIHGSINNLGSIIATEEDYKKCYEDLNKGLIGSKLKLLLATKVVVFIGYSFGDEDFNKIYDFLYKDMKGLLPHSYIVTISENTKEKYKGKNITPIITDATYFINELKEILVKEKVMLSDDIFSTIYKTLVKVKRAHEELSSFNISENPEVIYSLCYQDGLIHAFERILSRQNTGYYNNSCNIHQVMISYKKILDKRLNNKLYADAAYIEGYLNGLFCLINEDIEFLPLYYLFGAEFDLISLNDYLEASKQAKKLDVESYEYAIKYVKKFKNENGDLVIHHLPFL